MGVNVSNEELEIVFSRVKLRDTQAFEILYRRTNRKLYGLILSIVADRDIAAELLQEGYLKVWFAASHCPVNYPWAWMCQLMRNLAIDHIRLYGRRPPISGALSLPPETGEGLTRDDEKDTTVLHRCFSSLTAEKRQAIHLAYIHGCSHEEITEQLARPLGTIKSWIRRGLKELRQCMDG